MVEYQQSRGNYNVIMWLYDDIYCVVFLYFYFKHLPEKLQKVQRKDKNFMRTIIYILSFLIFWFWNITNCMTESQYSHIINTTIIAYYSSHSYNKTSNSFVFLKCQLYSIIFNAMQNKCITYIVVYFIGFWTAWLGRILLFFLIW